MRGGGRRAVLRGLGAAATAAFTVLMGASCPVGPGVSGSVDLAAPDQDAVRIVYLGVGGWIMERGDVQVLTAPLFSNPSFLRTGLTAIESDSAAIARGLTPYDVSDARAILTGHGHYDHLMDVPEVARTHAPRAVITATRTMENLLGTWSGVADRLVRIEEAAGDAETVGRWIDLGPGLRVMPLRSHHAPHFDGYTLYAGTVEEPRDTPPRWATEWLDGPSYSFLIDFLDADGSVAFRIYYQDSVAAAPRGFAPVSLMRERPVDVAVFVPSTFDQVDWHPEAFVENLRPRWVLLGHWEDFWVPPETETRSISLTDMSHFRRRLSAVHGGAHWLPDIGTEFRFPVR